MNVMYSKFPYKQFLPQFFFNGAILIKVVNIVIDNTVLRKSIPCQRKTVTNDLFILTLGSLTVFSPKEFYSL